MFSEFRINNINWKRLQSSAFDLIEIQKRSKWRISLKILIVDKMQELHLSCLDFSIKFAIQWVDVKNAASSKYAKSEKLNLNVANVDLGVSPINSIASQMKALKWSTIQRTTSQEKSLFTFRKTSCWSVDEQQRKERTNI